MPLPLLAVWGLGALAAGGLGLAAKGAYDYSRANDAQMDAEGIQKAADERLESRRRRTSQGFEIYGQQKVKVQQERLGRFISVFSQIKNVEMDSQSQIDSFRFSNSDKISLSDIEISYNALTSALKGVTTGAASGLLLAYGAYSGTMMLATASTGTAISGLSGVAATNATLAWLGGGALSAGGAGVAGGIMTLTSVVAAPALLIFGGITAAKASKKLSEARSNRIKALEYADELDLICQKLQMICDVTALASNLLSKLAIKVRRSTVAMENVIATSGKDYSTYTQEEKNTMLVAFKFVQVTAALLEASILNEHGTLDTSVQGDLEILEEQYNAL